MHYKSILDNDLYKFTMSAAYFLLYKNARGRFEFTDRNKNEYSKEFLILLEDFLKDYLYPIKLNKEEKHYLRSKVRYLPTNYIEWLEYFQFSQDAIKIWLDQENHLHVVVEDYMYKATLYEVPLLAAISECYHTYKRHAFDTAAYVDLTKNKAKFITDNNLTFMEFGTRRRFSSEIQDIVVKTFCQEAPKQMKGTSNVYLAKKYNLSPMGTMAHEWIQFHQGIYGFKRANYLALEDWCKVYDGDLGIALTDTYTTWSFLNTFTLKHAKLFDGVRIDSGDEKQMLDMFIEAYKKKQIDPRSKTFVLSNALDFPKYKIFKNLYSDYNLMAGIGTNLTCDTKSFGIDPCNIVIKLAQCQFSENDYWEDVIKISDDEDKRSGNEELYKIAERELHLKDQNSGTK
ncbi:MAG: nicotinate phosphoribosyltransferase [Prevotella sp.]|nr:nicotinate phosphoribosyltransferase [Prevotella sp.]